MSVPGVVSSGSSPRVWGTHRPETPAPGIVRFIPTGVGNTLLRMSEIGAAAVHPHGYGEHNFRVIANGNNVGSSPRVWGTRCLICGHVCTVRFIPTGVGNTDRGRAGRTEPAVHPHGCGEHRNTVTHNKFNNGSSPRVWGTHVSRSCGILYIRFIPTGVGNTRVDGLSQLLPPVHPHGCGEHSLFVVRKQR